MQNEKSLSCYCDVKKSYSHYHNVKKLSVITRHENIFLVTVMQKQNLIFITVICYLFFLHW